MSETDDILAKLILAGAVEVAGLDPQGEFLYSFTPQIAEIFPEFYEHVFNNYSTAVMELWSKGYIDIKMDADGEELVSLNDKSSDPESLDKLNDAERALMDGILRSFDEQS
jgi:hypothetical protein